MIKQSTEDRGGPCDGRSLEDWPWGSREGQQTAREKELWVGGPPRGPGRGAPEVEPVTGKNIQTEEERPQVERTQSTKQEEQDERHIPVKFKSIRPKDRLTKAPDRPERTCHREQVAEPGGRLGCKAWDGTNEGRGENFKPKSLYSVKL